MRQINVSCWALDFFKIDNTINCGWMQIKRTAKGENTSEAQL